MNRNWQKFARQARSVLANSSHGEREAALRTVLQDSGWKNVNTVRRAIFALDFIDQLQRTHPQHHDFVGGAPFSVVEALARLYRADSFEALRAASDWALGKQSLETIRDAAKKARPVGLAGRTGKLLEEEFRLRAEWSIRRSVQRIVRCKVSDVKINYKEAAESPSLDYLYSCLATNSDSQPRMVAVLIVGPYQNTTLYRRRRFDWMLRAFGWAWRFDDVILVLPAKEYLADYKRWISSYGEAVARRCLSGARQIARISPRVHAISVNIPAMDPRDEAAIESLAAGT